MRFSAASVHLLRSAARGFARTNHTPTACFDACKRARAASDPEISRIAAFAERHTDGLAKAVWKGPSWPRSAVGGWGDIGPGQCSFGGSRRAWVICARIQPVGALFPLLGLTKRWRVRKPALGLLATAASSEFAGWVQGAVVEHDSRDWSDPEVSRIAALVREQADAGGKEYPSQYFGFTCTSKAAKGWLTYRIGRDVDLVKVRRVPATVVAPPPPAADCSSAETHWKSAESIGTGGLQ
jgi:hypothetical protein